MPIPTSLNDLSMVDSSNSPQGGDPVGGNIDDYFRSHAGIIARQFKQGTDLSSAATLAIPTDGMFFNVTGTVTITQFSGGFNGKIVFLRFAGAATIQNGATLITPTGIDVTARVGDVFAFSCISTGMWACILSPVAGKLETASWLPASNERVIQAIAEATVADDTDNTPGKLVTTDWGGVVPPGAILFFGGPTAPTGFLLCDGTAYSRTDYARLFAAIGSYWGAGDGSTTFNVPDMRGVAPRGLDSGRGLDPGRTIGSYQADDNKSHTHTGYTSTDPGHTHNFGYFNGAGYNNNGALADQFPGRSGNYVTQIGGAHAHTVTTYASGGTEARMKNNAAPFVIRY